MVTIIFPSFSTHHPGAVPWGLTRAVQEGISVACLMLLCGISIPRRAKKFIRACFNCGSTVIFSPKSAAMASRVRSSCVGPRPPVVRMSSDRFHACLRTPCNRAGLSPTAEV